MWRRPQRFNVQSRELQPAFWRILPGKHDLKQWGMGQAPHRLHEFNYLLERYVLMLLRLKHLGFYLLQQLFYGGPIGEIHPYSQVIDKESDELLDFTPSAIRSRSSNHNVMLS